MANLFVNLPLPTLNGPGASVSTDGMGSPKTVVVAGTFPGVTITVEASTDGGTVFAPVPNGVFTDGARDLAVAVAAEFMRVNVRGRRVSPAPFSANIDVGANDGGAVFTAIPLPTLNGTGTPVDISTFNSSFTFIAGGTFTGATITLEVSEDGVSYAPVVQFAGRGGLKTAILTGNFIRTSVSGRFAGGTFTATMSCGATAAGGGPAIGGVQSAITTLVFRPADPDGDRLNVFTTWAGVYAAVQALAGRGAIYLEFDDRFGATKIPPGDWTMTNDTIWTHYNSSPTPTVVELEDGARIIMTPAVGSEQRILTIVGTNMTVLSNRQGPIAPFTDTSFVLAGNRTRLGNSSALALPMIVGGGNNFVAIAGTNSLGGIGQGVVCPAPLIDAAGGSILVAGGHGFVSDGAFTTSVPGGVVTLRFLNDGFSGGSFPGQTYCFPALIAGGGTLTWLCQVRDRHLVNATVTATPYAATFNEAVMVDTSAIAITVNAPRANPAKGERLVVKDRTGNAAANNITIAGTGGDTVQNGSIATNGQAKTWISDGAGTWVHIATS